MPLADIEIIDLTLRSDSGGTPPKNPRRSSPIHTPPLLRSDEDEDQRFPTRNAPAVFKVPPTPYAKTSTNVVDLEDLEYLTSQEGGSIPHELPDLHDLKALKKLSRSLLEDRQDGRRLLLWHLDRKSPLTWTKARTWLSNRSVHEAYLCVEEALDALTKDKQHMNGMNNEQSETVMQIAAWFVCWSVPVRLHKSGIQPKHLKIALNNRKDFQPFWDFLFGCLDILPVLRAESDGSTRNSAGTASPSKKPKRVLLDYSNQDLEGVGPHKKRKYAVQESQEARILQSTAQQRVKEMATRQNRLQRRLDTMGINGQDSLQMVVNPGKTDDQQFISLNQRIGNMMQQHQKEGVQFMWREIIADHDSPQGCLLAHTMGLGKTMQVISLLVTIAEAAKSSDPKIQNQVPVALRRSRTLILCPPGLIENWVDEILMWAPEPVADNVGELRKVTSTLMKPAARVLEIEEWGEKGGILLVGFPMFTILMGNKADKKGQAPLSEEQHASVTHILLDRPNIIVADEAHAMKNRASQLARYMKNFRSQSRIALTGSPLSNNLEEYYSLIDWVAPSYLGDIVNFKANYQEPIQAGLYQDSADSQYRQSLKKLKALEMELDPKIHRADFSALDKKIGEKTEFIVRLPLTNLQKQIYEIYVDLMLKSSDSDEPRQTTLWAWLGILRLLCNHPSCFREKLLQKGAQKTLTAFKNRSKDSTNTEDPEPGATEEEELLEVPVSKIGISQNMIEKLLQPFETVETAYDSVDLSHKTQILMNILRFSKEARDKVLIFSHSIPTLDYIERLLQQSRMTASRIDGRTVTNKRQQLTKDFNTGSLDICLISTKAGGQGLNMYGANRVIIMDDHFNPFHEEQAIGRAYRLGQKKDVFVYRLTVGGTFEEALQNQSLYKLQLATRVVDKKQVMRRALSGVGDYLFHPKTLRHDDLTGFIGTDPLVLDRILVEHERCVIETRHSLHKC